MIQVIALRPYEGKDGKEKIKHKLITEVASLPDLFSNLDAVIENIPSTERWNVYYTALDCKDTRSTGGSLRRFKSQDVIPFDIDNLDCERIKDYIQIFSDVTRCGMGSTVQVFTGNGLQFLIQLNQPFTDVKYFEEKRIFYKAICSKIDAEIKKAGLPGNADAAVWSPARILRLPNTDNIKKTKGVKKATLLQPVLKPQEWKWDIAGIPEVNTQDSIEWNPAKSPKIDTKSVLSGCAFLKWVANTPNEVREPHFYAAMSIIGRMENGRSLAHKIAENIKDSGSDTSIAGYSHSEIDTKIDQALAASGPRTCFNINTVWGNCKSCKHQGSINCPVSLKGEDFIATKESGFHTWKDGKPSPAYNDLLKYFDQKYSHITLDQNGLVYTYTGTHFRMYTDVELKNFAEEHFVPKPKSNVVNEFYQKVKRTNIVSTDFFSENLNGLINFKNGILDVHKKTLIPHNKKYGFRYVLPYEYDPNATAPRFNQFLDEITGGDGSLRAILEEFGGYALSGDSYWLHKCLLLSGEGRNGKSKFIEALQLVAGKENYSNVDLEDLSNENSLQLLEGKLFNVSEEISHKAMRETKKLKAVTSGATVKVKLMWHQPYFIEMVAKQIFACNTLPHSDDTSQGFLERMVIVPFEQVFKGQDADPFLMDKFKKEAAGIFNIFLDGYSRLRKNKQFTRSDAADKSLEDYATDNNIVATWLKENDVLDIKPLNGRDTFVPLSELFDKFNDWIESNGPGGRVDAVGYRLFKSLIQRALPEGSKRYGRYTKRTEFEGMKPRGFFDVSLKELH